MPLQTTGARAEIPPVTDTYQKAHKNYVLWSALLASWQLIGITLETKEKWGVTLKSPNAVPLVLFCLVVYFGFKVIIEWSQCDDNRKQHIAARIDYGVAHAIAVSAIVISVVQYLLRIQIVDVMLRNPARWISLTMLFLNCLPLLLPFTEPSDITEVFKANIEYKKTLPRYVIFMLVLAIISDGMTLITHGWSWGWLLIASILAIVSGTLGVAYILKRRKMYYQLRAAGVLEKSSNAAKANMADAANPSI